MWSSTTGRLFFRPFIPTGRCRPSAAVEEPWRISVDIHAAAEVMPALIGGAEAVRLIGCDRPAAWLDGVIREYVDIEWVHEATLAILSEADGLPVKGGLLLDWWSGLDLRAHLAAVQATGRRPSRSAGDG